MGQGGLSAWLKFCTSYASPKGQLTLIHRAECLGELLALFERRFGDITVFPLFPKRGDPATRIILQGRKGSRGGVRLLQGLVLHEADGQLHGSGRERIARRRGAAARLVGEKKRKGRRLGGKGGSPHSPEREERTSGSRGPHARTSTFAS